MSKSSNRIMRIARAFGSRSSAFVLTLIAVLAHTAHVGLVSYGISSFGGWMHWVQAVVLAAAISLSLAYFTVTAKSDDKKSLQMVLIFFWADAILGIWYYANKLIFATGTTISEMFKNADWSAFSIALVISFLLPFIIKAFAGKIQLDEPDDMVDQEQLTKIQSELETINNQIGEIWKRYDDNSIGELYDMIVDNTNSIKTVVQSSLSNDENSELVENTLSEILKNIEDIEEFNTTSEKMDETLLKLYNELKSKLSDYVKMNDDIVLKVSNVTSGNKAVYDANITKK